MKYYAVLDANVLVSAMLKTGSVPGQVAAEALTGDIIPLLNDDIIAEYEDVLNRPKFRFDKRAVKVFLDELKKEYLDELWNDDSTLLKLFYSEYEYFKRQYDKEIDKILNGKISSEGPKRTWEQRELEKMTLQQWIEHDPVSGMKLRDEVFAAAEENGIYCCPLCGMQSPHRKDFQIDHIKPISKGGLTVRENLQILCRRCNWIKSDHEDDLPLASREVSEDILPGVVREGDKITVTLGDETKRFTITADRKRRGGMTFEIGGHTYAYEFSKGKLAVMN